MPCAAYDDNGKLVMMIAGPREKLSEARAAAAVTDPRIKFILFCRCEQPHQGLADATECETGEPDAMVLYPELSPDRAAPNFPKTPKRQSKRARLRARRRKSRRG